jgi:two-component system chemotaxis response regulator CheB
MKKKVLIIDDSAVMRRMLTDALNESPNIEVVGTAMDPYIAVNKIKKLQPDMLTLDIEMPRMDGLTFLEKLMIANPLPVIMVSAFTDAGANETLKALHLGAVDFILKPAAGEDEKWVKFSSELKEKIETLNFDKLKRKLDSRNKRKKEFSVEEKYSADVIIPKKSPSAVGERTEKIIAIGASTGGTEAIAEILFNLPADIPGIVITQHMPEKFTEAFAKRMDSISKITVKEAKPGDRLYKGMALIAPGNRHMLLHRDVHGYWVEINDGKPVNRHRPSVDVLFRSVAQSAGNNTVGILLTGMGSDGANGLLEIKDNGGLTIAQDEESCIVFGMPQAAINAGAASYVMDLKGIYTALIKNMKLNNSK